MPKITVKYRKEPLFEKRTCQHCNQYLHLHRLINILCLKCRKLNNEKVIMLKTIEDKYNQQIRLRFKKDTWEL